MTLLYERQRRNIYLFFLKTSSNFCERWKLIDEKKKKMCQIFSVIDLLERYTYLLCVRLCQDATSDLLNTVDIEVMEKGGIFGYRDRRSFVNFNKWRRNGKNGKRKEEEWKEKMEGREGILWLEDILFVD